MNLSAKTLALEHVEAAQPTQWRSLEPDQKSQLIILDVGSSRHRTLYETDEAVIEAPNWSPDGHWLVFNREGLLYKIHAHAGTKPELIPTGGLIDANNDHVISPDGKFIFISSEDGHVYKVPFIGGEPVRVTNENDGLRARYLHGISPDGKTLAFIGVETDRNRRLSNVFTISVEGGESACLTHSERPHDGAEFSPDGEWIYFNSERFSIRPGHAQLFRMRRDGGDMQQLTDDDRVNWFPHVSPDSHSMVYLSYDPGVTGHPANHPVRLILCNLEGQHQRTVAEVFGGQGTINVNSWAPDSQHLAYVAYPVHSTQLSGPADV